jgi:hypothetical protein
MNFVKLAAVTLVLTSPGIADAQIVLPPDAKPTCTVPAVEFASWFESGSVTPNGIVTPADSVAFPNRPNCSFYKWSQQMFLWLTSPVAPKFGEGNVVFNSQIFFDVTPADPPPSSERRFVPNDPKQPRKDFRPAISQRGPNDQPIVADKTGKIFSVVRPESTPDGRALARDKSGQAVPIEKTGVAPSGKPLLIGPGGKPIDYQTLKNGAPRLLDKAGKTIDFRLKTAVINGRTVFLDAQGRVIETEHGQADFTVLMTQNRKIVYYALQANDVFAYFLTGTKTGKITPALTQFPTTVDDLNKIKAFGLANGKTFPDANALAVELKSAWVEADGLDTTKYITMNAVIPTFDMSDKKKWTPNGSKEVLLAMIGLHVVGSAAGHPEMIWSTFEHVDNTRNAEYAYTDAAGDPKKVLQDSGGKWLLSATPPTATPNIAIMSADGPNIVAADNGEIGPGDTLRENPWGTVSNADKAADKNTELIAINNSVIGQLGAGDVRKNYILVGSTWTIGGKSPRGPRTIGDEPFDPANNTGPNEVGTSRSANSTMETTSQSLNCFACHRGNVLGTGGRGLSHIWGQLKPLFQ